MRSVPFLLLLVPSLHAQQERAPFDAATVLLDKEQLPFRRMLDVDLDGDPDAVGADVISDHTEYRLAFYLNDGRGLFRSNGLYYTPTHTGSEGKFSIEVGRLNGDAWPDVCVVYRAERQDWLGSGPPYYSYTLQTPVALPAPTQGIALADLDRDGIDDLVWVDAGALRVSVSGGGSASIAVPGVKHGVRVLLGDGPGGSDLFLVHANEDLRVFFGTASGLSAGPVFVHGVDHGMMDAGDVDGDGDVDAVVFGTRYRVLRRLTPASWTLEPAAAGGPAEFLRDVDGDGDLDGACCGGGGGTGGTYKLHVEPSDFELALNDGTGTFAPAFEIHGVGSPQLAGVVDVDGDGDTDLVAGRCVYFADGPIRPPPEESELPASIGPRALADCDQDGDMDAGFSVDSVYTNDGTGRFEAETPAVAPAPAGTAYRGPGYAGDFDGDGDPDLLVELVRASRAPAEAGQPPAHGSTLATVLLTNDGQGTLLGPVPAAPRGVSFAIDSRDPELSLLADADVDGDLDLLTRTLDYSFTRAETRLWANDGAGYFRAGGRERVYRSLWAGDVDLDGDMDMIAAGSGYEGTSTYLLLGSDPVPGRFPTFTWDSRPGYWPHDSATGLAEADLDQDGFPDFAMVTTEATLFDNRFDSGGSLAQVQVYGYWGLAPGARLALGDLDGDARIDFVAGPHENDFAGITEVRFRLAGPYFNFGAHRQVVPAGLLLDLDGDGDPDLLGERVVLNRTLP